MTMTSLFLTQLLAVFAITMGMSMLIKRKMLTNVFHEVAESRALAYILGVLVFLTGLAIILSGGLWETRSRMIIMIFGWVSVLEGLLSLFVSKKFVREYLELLDNSKAYYIVAISYLAMGTYLLYFGFVAQ